SRTSVLAYKDTTLKIPQIAEELGVATIVEAGIQRSGSRIRINAQLINAQTDEHLWAETYNRELTAENLFDIQAEIARSIAQALKATLSPEEEASIDRVLTTNLNAWQSYQRAVRMRESLSAEGMKAGIAETDRALKLDPGFAAAWSLRAILLLQQYWFFDTSPATRDAAWDAIQTGRAIDPSLPELDIAEGYYYYWGYRDYEKALQLMQKALHALPNSVRATLGRAYILRRMGRWEETLADMQRVTELDPLYIQNFAEWGSTLTVLHRFAEAADVFEQTRETAIDDLAIMRQFGQFDFWSTGDVANYAHVFHLGVAANPTDQMTSYESSLYIRDWQGAFQDVEDWPERFLDSKNFRVSRQMLMGLTWRLSGDADQARPLLLAARREFEALLEESENRFAILRSLCFIDGGLGDIDAAQQSCASSLGAAPDDAFTINNFKFHAAVSLALAGDVQGSLSLLESILSSGIGPPMYEVMYHPAFDDIRQDPAYIGLLKTYSPENNQP
ncbi:MAG: hypothetical protein GQ538_00585, partial [Xanthomonadales bacterium]|nr:hypothetical protein [Xanthomonadales bacterium]